MAFTTCHSDSRIQPQGDCPHFPRVFYYYKMNTAVFSSMVAVLRRHYQSTCTATSSCQAHMPESIPSFLSKLPSSQLSDSTHSLINHNIFCSHVFLFFSLLLISDSTSSSEVYLSKFLSLKYQGSSTIQPFFQKPFQICDMVFFPVSSIGSHGISWFMVTEGVFIILMVCCLIWCVTHC